MRAMFHKRILPVILLLVWASAPTALADGRATVDVSSFIGAISRLYGKLEYEEAFAQIELARQRPLATRDVITLYLYEGILLFEMGRLTDAGDAFQMALSLNIDVELPEQVAPKVEAHLESIRKLVKQELESSTKEPSAPAEEDGKDYAQLLAPLPRPAAPTEVVDTSTCSSSPVNALGRTLKAQQLWRIATMEQMLCERGRLRGSIVSILSDLHQRMMLADSSYQRLLISQEISKASREFSVYPEEAVWSRAKVLLPRAASEIDPDDMEIPLPVPPARAEAELIPDDEPRDLFGCQVVVAAECERLMRRMLLLQEQSAAMSPSSRQSASRDLFRLGRRIRDANTREALVDASRAIDFWSRKWR